MQKMVAKADNFIGVMRHAEASCKESMGRNVADFDDDVDRTVKWVFSQTNFDPNDVNLKTRFQILI